jgi:pseudouridine-5'-phosphate glycosidase
MNRAGPGHVALETTLLVHGVPRDQGIPLARELAATVKEAGAQPAFIGIHAGRPTVGLSDAELGELLSADDVPKANTANLGILLHRKQHGATTVSTTMELSAAAGIRVFATGGLGGVHRNYGTDFDISSDLAAFTRFPIAVVTSGVKSILDVGATREALETLGIPVIGFETGRFPAFYQRAGDATVDARFDDPAEMAKFVAAELTRTGRGIVVANPIPAADEIPKARWEEWLAIATRDAEAAGVRGRGVTPFLLGKVHQISGGVTLKANIALVKSNARLAGRLCRELARLGPGVWTPAAR